MATSLAMSRWLATNATWSGKDLVPRMGHIGVGRDDLDEYDNLVLLCKVHDKLVDDQPETYPVDRLASRTVR